MNRNVGNLAPMPGVFPDYPAPVIRSVAAAEEMVLMRWGMPPPIQDGRAAGHQHPQHVVAALGGWQKPENRCLVPANSFAEYAP